MAYALPAVGKGTTPHTAAGLQSLNGSLLATAGATLHQLHGFQAFVVYLGCSDYNLTASRARCAKYTSAGLGWWDLGRGGLALGCGGQRPLCCQAAQAAGTWELLLGW